MNRNVVVAMFIIIGMQFTSGSTQNPNPAVRQNEATTATTNQSVEPIGSAKMLPDGALVLSLRAETGDFIGHAEFKYKKGDRHYAGILRHIGGLQPGEEKVVMPFPEKN